MSGTLHTRCTPACAHCTPVHTSARALRACAHFRAHTAHLCTLPRAHCALVHTFARTLRACAHLPAHTAHLCTLVTAHHTPGTRPTHALHTRIHRHTRCSSCATPSPSCCCCAAPGVCTHHPSHPRARARPATPTTAKQGPWQAHHPNKTTSLWTASVRPGASWRNASKK